jgi:cobalt-zinc-cadmium efflux system protein
MSHVHHRHHAPVNQRAFVLGVALNLGFVAVEALFGYLAHSLALLADAGHNLSDVVGLGLAWAALRLARLRPTARHTYGLRRASILAALGNALLLLAALGGIAWEAVQRLADPQPVASTTVIIVAGAGVLVNGITALFFSGHTDDLNIRGAFLHMAADAAVSLGVVIAALITLVTGWMWLDPAVSLAIVGLLAVSTWSLLRESVSLAMDGVPRAIDLKEVAAYLRAQPDVQSVHDLHVWALSTTESALTAHVVTAADAPDALLQRLNAGLHDRFGIEHATIQLEWTDCAGRCEELGH